MDIDALREYLTENHGAFEKWGNFVAQRTLELLEQKTGTKIDHNFIKIPPKPRIKDIDSAIGKVARKGYTELSQLTDLVGVRFVVLLSDHISILSDIIENETSWNGIISKDFQEEIEKNPKIFDYQSQHYEVRPKNNFDIDGIQITTEMCCEVQIRTLLQHAYAEMVHDNIYKPVGPVPLKAERQVAKSMALMETTDDLFCSTMKLLTDTNLPRNNLLNDLNSLYRAKIGGHLLQQDTKTCFAVFDTFREIICEGLAAEISQFVENKKFIPLKIQSRAPSKPFFAQPAVLFAYWLAENIDIKELVRRWPLPGYQQDLQVILSDLGAGAGT